MKSIRGTDKPLTKRIFRMIPKPGRSREVELWKLTTGGEQGIRNTHGRENCGGVVDTHDVCAAQYGCGYDGGVSGGEKGRVLWVRFVLAI